ncbi:16891_t:CDS:2, partial [Racocetra fulgida]
NKKDIAGKKLADFREGINKWEQEKIAEARKKMVLSVINLALCFCQLFIVSIDIINLIENINKTFNSVKEAVVAVKVIIEKINVTAGIKIINNVIDNIKKIQQIIGDLTNNLAKLENFSDYVEKRKGNIESLDIDTLAKTLETEGRIGIYLRMAEWKSIKKDMRKLLNYPIEQQINGASEYLNSLNDLFNYIDAYIEAKIEEMESFKEYSRIKLQVEMFKKKEIRLKDMIDVYKERQDNCDEIELLLFERLIGIKCWMSTYIENYRSAYYYWSLSESKIKPSVMKTIHQHMDDRKDIKMDMETTLTKFKGEPQHSRPSIHLTEEEYIKKFRHDRFITLEITLDHKEFLRRERVRLNKIEVFLEGVGSEGVFADKYEGKTYSFRSEPIRPKVFEYKVPNSIKTEALFTSKNYFIPTPFSQWKIKLDDSCKVDLSELKSINIELSVDCYFGDKKNNNNQKKPEFEMLLKDCNDITKLHEHLKESEYKRHKSASNLMTKLGKELM